MRNRNDNVCVAFLCCSRFSLISRQLYCQERKAYEKDDKCWELPFALDKANPSTMRNSRHDVGGPPWHKGARRIAIPKTGSARNVKGMKRGTGSYKDVKHWGCSELKRQQPATYTSEIDFWSFDREQRTGTKRANNHCDLSDTVDCRAVLDSSCLHVLLYFNKEGHGEEKPARMKTLVWGMTECNWLGAINDICESFQTGRCCDRIMDT